MDRQRAANPLALFSVSMCAVRQTGALEVWQVFVGDATAGHI